MRFKYLLLLAAAATAVTAQAASIGYVVTVNTPNFGAPGWIDLSFNQANAATSLSATATIWNFQATGYVLDSTTQSTPGVTGFLGSGPLVIPNDVSGANYFTQGILAWGSMFSFTVVFEGPAVGTPAADGSEFRVTLFDAGFNPFVAPLGGGEVANVTINPAGDLSTFGSTFDGGSASIAPVPEPHASWLLGPGLGALLLLRRRVRV
ncbi:MAG: NF038129 family PEP-CTERM protein [Candidatus Solibacter sp.]